MKKKTDKKDLIAAIIAFAMFIGIAAFGIYLGGLRAESIIESGMPTWLKFLLL